MYVCVAQLEEGVLLMGNQLQMHKFPQRGEVNLSHFPGNATSRLHPHSIIAKQFKS